MLGIPDIRSFDKYTDEHKNGTIIYFENVKDGIRNSTNFLKKLIALYFRFSLLDNKFNIFVDDGSGVEKITYKHLDDLAGRTQFLWNINKFNDPYIKNIVNFPIFEEEISISVEGTLKGFIASVDTPKQLKILNTEEKVSVDLFVNGRLREKDILRHIPRASIVETYLYGQVHFNDLDGEGEIDRFTSSREGVVADDPKFKELLDVLRKILARILVDWDKGREKINQDGDSENNRMSKKERKSRELFNAVSKDYSAPKKSGNKSKVDLWVDELADDAQFNFSAYAECFISENLVRKYIEDKNILLSKEAEAEKEKWKRVENDNKNMGNISIDIRRSKNDLSYLSMDFLANLVDKAKDPIKEARLSRDAKEYKPIRDALAHTALLTDVAKSKLTTVYENIKGRVKALLSDL